MIEMENMRHNKVGPENKVTHQPHMGWNRCLGRSIQGYHSGHSMGYCAIPTDQLGKALDFPRTAVYQDGFETPEQSQRGQRIDHLFNTFHPVHGDFDSEVPFGAFDRIAPLCFDH